MPEDFYLLNSTDSPPADAAPKRFRPARCVSDGKRREARMLFERGVGYKAAATILELSANTVRDWARAYKRGKFNDYVSRSLYRYSDESREAVLRLRMQGLSWHQIAAETGVNISTCRNWVKRASQKQDEQQ